MSGYRNDETCYVYLAEGIFTSGRYKGMRYHKIGMGKDPSVRARALKMKILTCVRCPTRYAAYQIERALCDLHSKRRIMGKEWFVFNDYFLSDFVGKKELADVR